MKKAEKILGKTLEMNAVDALQLLEAGISEGILTPISFKESDSANLFGRRLQLFQSADLEPLHGLVATGLRSAALLPAASLEAQYANLRAMARERLATVVHLFSPDNGAPLLPAPDTGFFQMASSNAQEAVDLAIMAHRIAELSLIPGLHSMETPAGPQMIDFPDADGLRRFLGQADDRIPCPTPAQRMIFGEYRRRLPNWFNFDHPTLHGARKNGLAADLEAAAGQQYFYHHLPKIIAQVFDEFAELTTWRYRPVQTHEIEKADFLILSSGSIYPEVVKVVDRLRTEEKSRVGCLRLNLIRPFPAEDLAQLLRGKKGITILEPLSAQGRETSELYAQLGAILGPPARNVPELYYGQYGSEYTRGSIERVFRNMMRSGAQRRHFYLDIHFTRENTAIPTHEILLQNIRRDYPQINEQTLTATAGVAAPGLSYHGGTHGHPGVPMAVRKYQDQGPPYSRLSRFYADTASFYQANARGELVADPFQALPLAPTATAAFAGVETARENLPVFHPEKCTACGDCYVYCPHAALPPLALGVSALVKGAMQMAAQRGTPVSKLTPLVRNLGKVAGKIIQQQAGTIRKAGDFLPEVFEKLLEQTKPDEERSAVLREEFKIITDLISTLPVSVTDVLFTQAEKQQPGSGELFTIAVDPQACTACGLCTEVCAENALSLAPQDAETLSHAQDIFQIWEQLPDTAGDTISRLQQTADYNPFAATLLSRNFYGSMNGAALSETGAPVKAMVHLITALAESVWQPQVNKQLKELEKTTDELAKAINKLLTKALPSSDFDGIAAALNKAETPRLPLDELIGKLEAEEHLDLLDAQELQRKIDLYNDLRELQKTLAQGPTGAGRARYGLILALEGLPWAEQFPLNSFTAPALLQGGNGSPARLWGALQGHFRHLLDNLRLLRRAQLEIRNKYRPEQHDAEIAALHWEELDEAERALIPSILLIGTQTQLAGADHASLRKILSAGWPVKVVLLNTGSQPDGAGNPIFSLDSGLLYATMTTREAFILQSGMGDFRHLFDGLLRGLASPRPALFHLLAVDDRHRQPNADNWPRLARLARDARILPFFRFDPDAEGEFLAQAIDLSANPTPESDWIGGRISYAEEGETKEMSYRWTPADWLYARTDWASHFRPFRPDAGTSIPIAEYLPLDPKAREGKIPFILSVVKDGLPEQVQVSGEVVRFCEAVRQSWNSLRELAGIRTIFPQKVRETTERELQEKYEAELAQLRSAYEDKLRNQETELMQQVKIRLREKLLALSRRDRTPKV